MNPIPRLPPNISPTTTPINPSATPWRTPVKMNGTDPGSANGRENLPVRGAKRPRRAQQVAIDVPHSAHRIHQNGEECRDKNDEDLRPHAHAEPNDDHRHHGDARRRVQRVQRTGRSISRTVRYQPMITSATHSGNHRQRESDGEIRSAVSDVVQQRFPASVLVKRLTMADGPLRNSGEIFPADHNACHTAITIASRWCRRESKRLVPLIETLLGLH